MITTPATMADLQAAWGSSPSQSVVVAKSIDLERVGVSTSVCRSHLLPFDAVEQRDPKRPGYTRSTCRRCGRFLGYRTN